MTRTRTCDFCGETRPTLLYRDPDGDTWVGCDECITYEQDVAEENGYRPFVLVAE